MDIIFIALVLIGFVAQFLATFPTGPWTIRVAWGAWLAAALIWAISRAHGA